MDVKYIESNIARLRVSRRLSQGNLGKEIGLSPSAISNIENAISYKILRAYNVGCMMPYINY